MELDLNQFDAEIARYDAVHQNSGGEGLAFGAKELSLSIAQTIVPTFQQLNEDTQQEFLDKIEFLCAKAVEFSPSLSSRRILKGQFYLQVGRTADAAVCFMEAYNIEKDVKAYPWPHVPKTAENAGLLIWMGSALHHAGEADLGKKFFDVGKEWETSFFSSSDYNEDDFSEEEI